MQGLMIDGELFIAANTAELTVGGMTLTFAAEFTAAKDAFDGKHSDFLQAEETSKVLRDDKVNANNKLFQVGIAMCEDGKKIFRKEPAIRDQFTWSTVQALITNTQSSHSVKGLISDSSDDRPIEGAKVAVLDKDGIAIEGKEMQTGLDGAYNIKGLKSGDYSLKVEAVGYTTVDVPFVIDGAAVDLDVGIEVVVV